MSLLRNGHLRSLTPLRWFIVQALFFFAHTDSPLSPPMVLGARINLLTPPGLPRIFFYDFGTALLSLVRGITLSYVTVPRSSWYFVDRYNTCSLA